MSQSNGVFIFEIQSLAEEESREYKFLYDESEVFVFYLYFNIQNTQKIIMYQQLLLFVTWVSSLPFQFIVHSLTVWWITTTVSLCDCISLVNQTLIN